MRLFRLALKVTSRHMSYALVYVVALTALTLVGSGFMSGTPSSGFETARPTIAVIDHDESTLSQALATYAESIGKPVDIGEGAYALQDAAAKGTTGYVLIIPENYGADMVAAAHAGTAAPDLECVVSYAGASGSLADVQVRGYAQTLYGFAASDAQASQSQLVSWADESLHKNIRTEVAKTQVQGLPASFLGYALFSFYPACTGGAVLVAVGCAALRTSEIRRRLEAAPSLGMPSGIQLALACTAIGLAVGAFIAAAGLIAFNPLEAGASIEAVAVAVAGQLSAALLGAALGFLLWQIGVGESAANAAANCVAMVLTFCSGSWVPLSTFGPDLLHAMAFTPFYWITQAITAMNEVVGASGTAVPQAVGDLGISLAFTAVIAVAAAVLGRMRTRRAS